MMSTMTMTSYWSMKLRRLALQPQIRNELSRTSEMESELQSWL